MEFAYSHVVCNWKPAAKTCEKDGIFLPATRVPPAEPDYDNTVGVKQHGDLPPLPPRRLRKGPTSLPLPSPPTSQHPHAPHSLPPPVPPRFDKLEIESKLKANVNIVSISVGKLVDISQDEGMETLQRPVVCGKCSAALSCLSTVQTNVWVCEFCGRENGANSSLAKVCIGRRTGVRSDDLYLPSRSDDDYQNLEDTLVIFCVDISGSMCVTTEVPSESGSPVHISRLEGMQDALQQALASILQQSPRRRVALVTFNDEVVIYGDGTRAPLTLRDWALVDYDHIWKQAVAYSIPHCIAETYNHLIQRVKDLMEHGATSLGPAVLASVAMASRYPGSKVVLCTDGQANIGLGDIETVSQSSSPLTPNFYQKLALQAVEKGVITSVMTFKGTDCCLADIGRLADVTGGRVNIVSIGNVATQVQSLSEDNVLATGVTATLLASDGVYFPYEEENKHKLTRQIGNVTKGLEITVQFAVKPEFMDVFLQKDTLPFQLQLSFKTRDQQAVTRIITELRPVTTGSRLVVGGLNMAVLGVHCAQLCASLTMEGRVQEAQKQLKVQQELLEHISKLRPMQKEENIYGNWMDTMTVICDDITTESKMLSDEAAEVVYQMRRASSNSDSKHSNKPEVQKKTARKKRVAMEAV